jgi:uncharacterized protein (DUF58 family)
MPRLQKNRSRLTREGWYYLAFSLFVLGGAALREVNLLVVLGGLMFAPLLLSWRHTSVSLRWITVERRMQRRLFAGEPALVTLDVHNNRRRMSTWMMRVEDVHIRQQAKRRNRKRLRGSSECIIPAVHPQSTVATQYRILFGRRGEYQLGPIRISSQFPLGIVRSIRSVPVWDSILVYPQIGRLLPGWYALLESEKPGTQQSSSRQGYVDGDFYGLRDWRSGDSRRWIHWRTTARIGRLAVRQFERQNKPDFALIVDPFSLDDSTLEIVERAISFAATIVVNLAREGVNQLAFGIADSQGGLETQTNHRAFTSKLLERLAMADESKDDEPLTELLIDAQRNIRLGTKLVVISTRPNVLQSHVGDDQRSTAWDSISTILRATWIDCSSKHWTHFFGEDEVGSHAHIDLVEAEHAGPES